MLNFYLAFILIFTFIYFITFMLLKQGLFKLKHMHNVDTDKKYTSVSVIISARNEHKNLPALFECLVKQETAGLKVEFIIINDRSEDNSLALMEKMAAENPCFKILNITDKVEGFAPKKRAIDLAIKQACADIILLTDADGRPGPQWIQSFVNIFNQGAEMVIGYAPYDVKASAPMVIKMLALEYFSHAAIAAATTGLNYPLTCVGTNMAYLKRVYREIGGFGEYKAFISGDDDLFLTRVREHKRYKVTYASQKESQVSNAPPKSFRQFVNQRLRYASKGFNYPLRVTVVLTLYVIYNLFLFSGPFLGILFNPLYFWISAVALLIKMLTEYSFVRQAAHMLNDRRFTPLYFLTSFLHIPYVLFFGILGQLKIFKWAEKKAEYGISKKTGVITHE